ncbi:MAG TPA: protein translocase subunit SecF [Candidatus Wildermuthbacteria bacterium]|nr:protein translocase subunit SecF [Candidatus Wildermuthbacteria bacterium]
MFVRYGKILFYISMFFVTVSLAALAVFGLNVGIDFTGGSIMEISYQDARPEVGEIQDILSNFDLGSSYVQPIGENGMLIRTPFLTEDVHQQVFSALGENVSEMRFEAIGPVIGQELRSKVFMMAFLALAAIVLYIIIAFRRMAEPLRSWHYSVAAVVALLHDFLIPMGVFAFLGAYYEVQFTIPVVVGLLTVLGYSINDTVVVFDRIRENLQRKVGTSFQDTINISLRQTILRSLSTSFTTLLVLVSIFVLGGETLRYFALALIIGVIAGTYSSLFVAPPLLLLWTRFRRRS